MNRANHLISLSLVFTLVNTSLLPLKVLARGESELKSAAGAQPVSDVDENSKDDQQGLRFRLSQGVDQPESLPLAKVTTSTTLSKDETATVLSRLPPIKAEHNDEADFALRDRSLPPPRTGKTISAAFPPAAETTAPAAAAGTLQVLRFAPEGTVPLAANLIITFSQPMVAVSSQEAASKNVPVRVSPQPEGRWRWIGTRTLQFDPDGKFPMATSYSVTVPAGTRSASGNELSASTSWNFTTPAPTVKRTFPEKDSKERGDTLLFVAFDQRIDPAAVVKTIRLGAGNLQMKARLATSKEIKAHKEISKLAQLSEAGRWLAFRPVSSTANHADVALPPGARVRVSVGPGTQPKARGSRQRCRPFLFAFMARYA